MPEGKDGSAQKPALLDVVTVPDFDGPKRAVFEWRTLFFLASWKERVTSRRIRLHLACIGEPPESVQRLADDLEARVTLHPPVSGPRVENKLRAFEVQPESEWLLLLDTDVLFLNGLDSVRSLMTADAVYVAPVDRPKIQISLWPEIYGSLGLERPTGGAGTLQMRMSSQSEEGLRGYPYYNGGVILIPWRFADFFWRTWEHENRRIRQLVESRADTALNRIGDQEGLATTLEIMKSQGMNSRLLPDRLNGRWRHLYMGAPSLKEIEIFHATGFLSGFEGDRFGRKEMERYRRSLRNRFLRAFLESPRMRDPVFSWPRTFMEVQRLIAYLKRLQHRIDLMMLLSEA